MNEQERLAYLKALGIQTWQQRSNAAPVSFDAESVNQPAKQMDPELLDPADVTDTQAQAMNGTTGLNTSGAAREVNLLPWDVIQEQVSGCTLCDLHQSRTQTVFGTGTTDTSLMIIGEAPGADEDKTGQPFVGRAGKLLDLMLKAVGFNRDSVFIANVLKCRPPNNRDPHPDEVEQCLPYLQQQIAHVNPDVILAVGKIAAHNLIGGKETIGKMRNQIHGVDNELLGRSIPMVVTYHPAYLLRRASEKHKSWEDLKLTMSVLKQTQ